MRLSPRKAISLAAIALILAGCGSIDMKQVAPTVVAPLPAPGSTPTTAQLAMQGVRPCVAGPTALELAPQATVTAIVANAAAVTPSLPPLLAEDSVVKSLVASVSRTALIAHRNAMAAQGQTAAAATAENAIAQVGNPGTLSNSDFRTFAEHLSNTVLNPVLAPGKKAATAQSVFWKHLVAYYSAYFDGKFVDRLGGTLSKPTLSRTISDDEIASVVAVFVELLADTIVVTPVWKDGDTYYPGGSKDEPTALASGIVASPTTFVIDTTACGMTLLKARAVNYLAHTAAVRASMLGGLVTGSFGGLNIGLGVLGKLSIGDNQTLQVILKTALAHAFARAAEQASYVVLSRVGYSKDDGLADLVAYFFDQSKS